MAKRRELDLPDRARAVADLAQDQAPADPGGRDRRLAARDRVAATAASARCWSAVPTPDGLRYVGRVGSGFTDRQLDEIDAQLEQAGPQDQPADRRTARGRPGRALGHALPGRRGQYGELTGPGRLRHPVWRGCAPTSPPTRWSGSSPFGRTSPPSRLLTTPDFTIGLSVCPGQRPVDRVKACCDPSVTDPAPHGDPLPHFRPLISLRPPVLTFGPSFRPRARLALTSGPSLQSRSACRACWSRLASQIEGSSSRRVRGRATPHSPSWPATA